MENIKIQNRSYINMMKDIFEISAQSGIKTYIWGDFALDILAGRLLRAHGDLDCFTENLTDNIYRLIPAYMKKGYRINYLKDISMLQISKNGVHAAFNNLEYTGNLARWYHIGIHGIVTFPKIWLDETPRELYGVKVYTAGVKFLYALGTNPHLLSSELYKRKKDGADIKLLKKLFREECYNSIDISFPQYHY